MEEPMPRMKWKKLILFYIRLILENGAKKPLNFGIILYPFILYKTMVIPLYIAVFFFGIISFKNWYFYNINFVFFGRF